MFFSFNKKTLDTKNGDVQQHRNLVQFRLESGHFGIANWMKWVTSKFYKTTVDP